MIIKIIQRTKRLGESVRNHNTWKKGSDFSIMLEGKNHTDNLQFTEGGRKRK